MTSAAIRATFADAAQGFVAVVSGIGGTGGGGPRGSGSGGDGEAGRPSGGGGAGGGGDIWDAPGLGEWTVRDLIGHASRSFTTIETYLAHAAADPPDEIVVRTPLDYLMGLQNPLLDPVAIIQRGRDAGAALGDDPPAAVQELARRVTALVDVTPDDALLRTLFGGAIFLAYLPSRTFELTVHTLDLVDALGVPAPAILDSPIAASLQLAAAVAGRGRDAGAVLLALTGRHPLRDGFSVV
jgi:Mycothiol maleylpyruvate isomerase N-terminal domain